VKFHLQPANGVVIAALAALEAGHDPDRHLRRVC
jgi:hypothetical protein